MKNVAKVVGLAGLWWAAWPMEARGEAMLQYFNTSWAELTRKMPELAEAGYDSLWLPPPTKGSGGLSVGYDCWDRFDLGSKDQRGSVRTRYGTEAELLEMVRTAHRFGIRVYFDNVMNHNAFDVPAYNAFTPIDVYPGFVPEDFHLRKTEDGFYRKWDNVRDYNDAWQVQNLGLADLIDIATEPGGVNRNHGAYEGDTIPKIEFVRHPQNPEYYCYVPTGSGQKHSAGQGSYVGFGPGNGITTTLIQANPSFYAERVEDLLHRSARWKIDRTKADGFRLDAVKHTPADFFGATFGSDKDSSGYGYNGQIQVQFNLTRGFSDWDNHRDSVFNTEQGRDDAMLFGEHLGQPPAYGSYIDSGMRLVDNDLRSNFNGRLGNPSAGLEGYDQPGSGGFAPTTTVMHAQSHDNDYAARRELQHAFYFTREGIGLVYTDGNYHAETLGESGGAFPRHANTSFLGQWGDVRVPNLLKIHQDFARGYQRGRWSSADLVSYERIDTREFSEGDPAEREKKGATMLIAINDNYASGIPLSGGTSFASSAGAGSENDPNTGDEYLYQYARGDLYQTGYYKYASDLGSVIVPSGSYVVFAPRTPEESDLWKNAGGAPITFWQGGQQVGTVEVERRDGSDGDPGFNPYGLEDEDPQDFTYRIQVPRVTAAEDLTIRATADGSAENILLRLDGGIDLNGSRPAGNNDPFDRDHPPALSTDVFLGYEQPAFVRRQHAEKFAAKDTSRNQTGSAGAETYAKVIGSPGFTLAQGPAGANSFGNDGGNVASFLYHDPEAVVGGTPAGGWPGGTAPLQYSESGPDLAIWAKPNGVGGGFRMFLYYTVDGSNPEGAGGAGAGTTRVAEMNFSHNQASDDWWMNASVPKPSNGATFKYKIGIFKEGASSVYPSGPDSVTRKKSMLTTFEVQGFDPGTVTHSPHNDYASSETGLAEGFHVVRARAFLNRLGKASMYRTFTQTFYYDAARPGGEIVFPGASSPVVGGSEYGVVVRADASTDEVWYRITDSDATNDDAVTQVEQGNGAWVRATEVTPTASITPSDAAYRREFRFNYINIPASGSATLEVRLKELSSSAEQTLTDEAGHYTTLTRVVTTAGPDLRMFVAYPTVDGTPIDEQYMFKVHFSKALADGLSPNDLLARFRVRYGPDDAWPNRVQTLDAAEVSVIYNETPDFHALAFALPNLYDGRPEFLHRVEVLHDRPGALADLLATRRVKAAPSTRPRVTILQPQEYDSNGKKVEIVLPDGPGPDELEYTVRVETDLATTEVDLGFLLGSGHLEPVDADPELAGVQPMIEGSSAFWDFVWTIDREGSFRLEATAQSPGGVNADRRNVTVIRRQQVASDPDDLDDDDDGLADFDEGTPTPLPNGFPVTDPRYKANSEQWTNGEVHISRAYGRSHPLLPDSDGDGLPDGLEVGWRTPGSGTSVTTDTNGDGIPNFLADLDPPFYNTLDNLGSVPGVNSASEGGDRTRQLFGSTTDPGNPDTDGDGLPDGVEDANRNGWVDGDGEPLAGNAAPTLGRNWPNGRRDAGEVWLETSPTDADTDDDGLSDGYGEDKDASGTITGDTNGDRVWQEGEVWTETDPLQADTDGDGLPDGWEVTHGLNPLSDGERTMDGSVASVDDGAQGDPDGDGLSNLAELLAGTDPRADNSVVPQPGEAILIGPVAESQAVTRGSVTNRQEFTDWKKEDLVVLDEYEGDGSGNQGGDTYLAYDGFDSSRDLVAFYARDGGDPSVGGTGEFYFRVDLQDLRPFAEEGNLDLYVVIDSGNPAIGEYTLPDDLDTGTQMRWEAVVAVYQSNQGAVYVDTAPANNTTSINEDLAPKGVQRRDQNTPNGFRKAYFDSRLDAVEFSISRQALLDAGWLGDPNSLNFQVITVKDGTQNTPRGAGDIGGRTDIRDTIYDDYLAEDYWRDQAYISANSELRTWFNYAGPDRGKRAKVMWLIHGNDAVVPGSEIQAKLNTGAGAGYYRPLDVHDAYGVRLGLHVTPTLASAIEWAKADPAGNKEWRDGPGFNRRLGQLAQSGVVELLGTTFADAPMPYFDAAMIQDSIAQSAGILQEIYGVPVSDKVLWVPERVIDEDVLEKVSAAGFTHTFIDQFRHLRDRFGRTSALLDDGYRINRIQGVNAIVINDQASEFRFRNTDGGLDQSLRQLLSRKARSGEQHQMLVLFSGWADFANKGNADAYDANVAWLASRPWIEIVGPDQVARGEVDLSLPPDGEGDTFAAVERGPVSFGRKLGPLYLDHATQGNYDFWWFGSAQEESLRDKVFEIRPGTPIARSGDDFFGVPSFGGSGSGISSDTWLALQGVQSPLLKSAGRRSYHAQMYLAGWHDEDQNNLATYSTGDFIQPDTTYDHLAGFAKQAQAQVRHAAVFAAVDAWAANPPATSQSVAVDIDLDGEDEYVLKNSKIFAVFEAIGGRCTMAWARSAGGTVTQAVGNPLSFAGSETEHEGEYNQTAGGGVRAYRTSAFKDWYVTGGSGGINGYVNALYQVAPAPGGWTFTAPDGGVTKTITLADGENRLVADYQLAAGRTKAYVRFGLSPDLEDLFVRGQEGLRMRGGVSGVNVTNAGPAGLAQASIEFLGGAMQQATATDDDLLVFDTVPMRNQAQTQQVEIESLATSFSLALALEPTVQDADGDGLPSLWEELNGLDDTQGSGAAGASGDPDGDGLDNLTEWLTGLNPQMDDAGLYPRLAIQRSGGGLLLRFPTLPDRVYRLESSPDLVLWTAEGVERSTAGESEPGMWEMTRPMNGDRRFYRVVILPVSSS